MTRNITLGAVGAVLVAVLVAACGAGSEDATPAGCGLVEASRITDVLGADLTTTGHGDLARLQSSGAEIACTTTSTENADSSVTVDVQRHPEPLRLSDGTCSSGWVYAGTPDHYAPSCQEVTAQGSRTKLVARSGDYLIRVTILDPDRNWAGDPELALKMSKDVADRLTGGSTAAAG